MGKLPALQFYPRDWKSDLELQSCSLEARGLWIELMCVMHEANPYGYLAVNGSVPSDNQVSKLVGTSLIRYRKLKAELLSAGVARIDSETGMIYSKRMRDDAALREVRRQAGKQGGNPDLLNQKDKQEVNQKVNQGGYPPCTPPSSSSSSSSSEGGGGDIPPHLSAFAEEARKIPGWDFTIDQETSFFETLCQDFHADVIRKATRDLHAYQLSEGKPYKNPMRALRNWCAKEQEWQKERGEPEEKREPAKDEQGNVLIPIGGELVPAPEFDRLLGEHAIYKTSEGWKRKEVS